MLKVKEYIEQNLYDENRKSYVRNTEDRRIEYKFTWSCLSI